MNQRLQRWGERALGEVRSVFPRFSSRFEPETVASTLDEQAGFQEIDVETPAPHHPRQLSTPEPPAAVEAPPPEPEHIERKTEPPRIAPDAIQPPSAIEPLPPPPQLPKPAVPRTIVAKPPLVREESGPPQRSEEHRDKTTPPARTETPSTPRPADTSLVQLKRLQEWIATPPRERAATQKSAQPSAPKPAPSSATPRAETRAATVPRSPPPARAEPATAPPQPVVVNIGTIIVRANPAAAPRPPAPPPAASLATFLARRTAGRP